MSLLRFTSIMAVAATVLSVACHHDSDTAPTTPTSDFTVTIDSATNAQIGVVNHAVQVSATVESASGASVGGLTANWTIISGSGSVASSTTTTDANGHATVDWTLGTKAGGNQLRVTIGGTSALATATGSPDVASELKSVTPGAATIVATASTPIVAQVVDRFGNGVQGITVTWTSSGGTIGPTSSVSGASGNAQITFTAPATPGTFSITATAQGLASLSTTVVVQ